MYKLNTIKQSILAVSIAAFVTGCGGGGGGSTTSATTSTGAAISNASETDAAVALSNASETDAAVAISNASKTHTAVAISNTSTDKETSISNLSQKSKAVQSGQVKNSATGKGLADVKVSIGDLTTTTDAEGYYSFSHLSASEEAVVNFEKEGYLLGSKKIQLRSLSGEDTQSSNYLEYSMFAYDYQWDQKSSDEISSPRINIDASVSYTNTKGKLYNGMMSVNLTILDNNEEELLNAFPGTFKGINSNGTLVQFETYGLISISLKDSNGNALSFAEGETGTVIFNKVSSSEKPDTLPLWYYDYEQGLWFEEGSAQLQADGSYKGEISHLGTWSLNKPLEEEAGIYRGRILNKDGLPLSEVRLQAIGDNWISSDLSTDENGVFEIAVIPGKTFKLAAYNYKGKYKACYNNTVEAIASGDISEK